MTNYKNLPNELKEQIFNNILDSIHSLKDLQKICKISKQFKNYCDKYYIPDIKPIIENIIEYLNIPSHHSITIYTKQKFKIKNYITKKNGDTFIRIYTRFPLIKILHDIITNIETQNHFKYNIEKIINNSIYLKNQENNIILTIM